MHTRLVGIDPEAVEVGLEVEVAFEKVNDQVTLPVFKPVGVEVDLGG